MKSSNNTSKNWFGGYMTKFFGVLLSFFVLLTLNASAITYFTVSSGEGLSTGDPDPNFTLASQPGPDTYTGVYSSPTLGGYYVSPLAGSTWISVTPGDGNIDSGNFDYQYSYSSDFATPTQVLLTGGFSADNAVTLEINDAGSYATASAPGGWTFESLYPIDSSYTIGTGPVTTTFDFIVYNSGGPSAFLVENFSASSTAVPEPSTWALLLGGLGLLAFWRKRTRRDYL